MSIWNWIGVIMIAAPFLVILIGLVWHEYKCGDWKDYWPGCLIALAVLGYLALGLYLAQAGL